MISLIPKRTLAVCACALGASGGAASALAAGEPDPDDGPAIQALIPVVHEQLVPASGRPTKRLQDRYLELHEKARKSGEKPGRDVVRDAVKERDGDLRLATALDVKRSVRVLKRLTAPPAGASGSSAGGAPSGQLSAIAACESGGDPGAVGGGGAYRGKYQFSRETWASVGGSGDPAAAPAGEQDKRAAQLLARDGAGHWPRCGS
ncbi:MAG: transglycosylase family protein [Actinomycetota bacterium]|nr:transglycosylase family protein [Actinomycetota bacterium]